MDDRSRSPLSYFTDGALLLGALQATVWGAVTAYELAVEPLRLALTLCLLALGSLLLVSLPKRGRGLTAAAVLCLWGWRVWKSHGRLRWGTGAVWCAVVNTFAQKLPTVQAVEPGLVLSQEEWAALVTDWLIVTALPVALALGWLLCRLRWNTSVMALTLLPLLPALFVTEAPAPLALAGLLGVWGVLALGSLTDGADPRGTARGRLPAAVAMALTLAFLLQTLPTTGNSQPGWAKDLRESVVNNAGRLSLAELWHWREWGIFGATGSSRYVDLMGRPRFTGRVALRVESDAPGSRLLRGWSSDVFTGTGWEPLAGEAQTQLEEIRSQGTEPLLLLGENVEKVTDRVNWSGYRSKGTMTVENVSAPGSCVYYPYGLYTAPEGAALVDGAHLDRERGWRHTLDFCPDYNWVLQGGSSYWRSLMEPDPGEEAYRAFVYEHYLTVDEESRQVLMDWWEVNGRRQTAWWQTDWQGEDEAGYTSLEGYILTYYRDGSWVYQRPASEEEIATFGDWIRMNGELAEGVISEPDPELYAWGSKFLHSNWFPEEGDTRYEDGSIYVWQKDTGPVSDEERDWYRDNYINSVTGALEEALVNTTAYDLNAPLCPEGENYLNYFLNESRRGWCMHYATTTALMLRCLGIPTRYVGGYTVRPTVREPSPEVHDYDAHAWAEYYLDGIGWLPLDLTPQAGYGSDIVQAGGAVATPTASIAARESETPAEMPTGPPEATPAPAEVTAAPTQAPQQGVMAGEEPGGEEEQTSLLQLWPVGGLALCWALWVLARGHRARRLKQPDTNAATLYAYILWERLKPWGAGEGEEMAGLAKKARFSQYTLTGEERRRALELLAGEVKVISRALPGWKKPVFRLLWGDVALILERSA